MKKIALVILSILASSSSFAKENEDEYVFASPFFDYIKASTVDAMNNEDNVYGLGMDVGYRYNNNVAIRARLEQLEIGNSTDNDAENFMLGLDGMYFLDSIDNDAYLYVGVRSANVNENMYGMAFGAGYEYEIDKNWSLRAELGGLSFFIEDKIVQNANIGVTYRFDQPQERRKAKEIEYYVYENKPIRVNLDVKFKHDSSDIASIYDDQILKVAEFLKKNKGMKVTIEGHASHLGSNEYNKKLSQRRSDEVSSYLSENYNIDKSRVTSIGFGEEKPLMKGTSKEANKVNRRVVAVLEGVQRVKVLKK
jgi:outer membrane protein OmpA-like peptidoglycan-associated protein